MKKILQLSKMLTNMETVTSLDNPGVNQWYPLTVWKDLQVNSAGCYANKQRGMQWWHTYLTQELDPSLEKVQIGGLCKIKKKVLVNIWEE